MEVRYQCTADDYREAQREHVKKSATYYFWLILGSVTVLLGLLIMLRVSIVTGFFAAVGGIFWLSWFPFSLSRWRIKRDFCKHPNAGLPCTLVVDGEGMEFQTHVSHTESTWQAYSEFLETPNLFVIYPAARMFFMIPKRAFSGSELEEFQRLLAQNLQRK